MPETTTAKTHFQNEFLSINVTKKPGCIVHLDIQATQDFLAKIHKQAIKDINKEVSLPGFRKGKAPEQMLIANFKQPLEKRKKELAMDEAFQESLRLTRLLPMSRRSVQSATVPVLNDQTAHIIIEYIAEPTVPEINIAEFTTKKVQPKAITEAMKARELRLLKERKATWEEVTGRSAEKTDYVEIDIDVIEHPIHNVCVNQVIYLADPTTSQWVVNTVIGMNVDEAKEVLSSPEEQTEEEARIWGEQKPKQCRITLKKIKVAHLPDENDEFAQTEGFNSFKELQEKINHRLEQAELEYATRLSRFWLQEELMEKYTFDLPESVIETEVNGRMRAILENGADPSKGALPKEAEQTKNLENAVRGHTIRFLRNMFLLRQIAQVAQIKVSEEEVLRELMLQMYSLPAEERAIYPGISKEDIHFRAMTCVMIRKCYDYLLEKIG